MGLGEGLVGVWMRVRLQRLLPSTTPGVVEEVVERRW